MKKYLVIFGILSVTQTFGFKAPANTNPSQRIVNCLVRSKKGSDDNNFVENSNYNHKPLTILQSSRSRNDTLSVFGTPLRKDVAQPLSCLLFAQFILFVGVGAVIPTIPLYGKEIGLSSAMNGLVISAPALALLLFAKPAGEFADKARKPAMTVGMALIAISDLETALAQGFISLVLARLGLGAGRCISESGERGLLADLASRTPDLRGRILASQNIVLSLGIAIGAPAGGLVVESYGPRAAFLCVTGAALISLFLYNFLPETLENKKDFSRSGTEVNELDKVRWGKLLRDSNWRGLSLFEIGAKFGYAAKLTSIPLLSSSILPGGAVGAGTLLSAAGLSGLFGAPLGGFLVDNIGAKGTIVVTGTTAGVGLMLIPFALQVQSVGSIPTWGFFAISVLLWSTSVASFGPATTALAQEFAPEGSEATAMALPRAAGDGVYLVAPLLLGTIADIVGIPVGSECFFAGFCNLLGVVALVLS